MIQGLKAKLARLRELQAQSQAQRQKWLDDQFALLDSREARLRTRYGWDRPWPPRAYDPKEARRRNSLRSRRIRENGGTHGYEDIHAQHERQGGKCHYCGAEVGQRYHVDHFMPLALGGSNGPENLVIACPHCNQSKGAKHPQDFAGRLL